MRDLVSIGVAAAMLGVCVNTMRLWHKAGLLLPCLITAGGHRRYDAAQLAQKRLDHEPAPARKTIAYARVSTHDQKQDLETQKQRLQQECNNRGYQDVELISDLGSGMNYSKKGLRRLLQLICSRQVERLVLISKDRLLRFGAELVFALCQLYTVDIVIVEPQQEDPKTSLVQDVLSILTVFSARCNGLKSHRNKRSLAAVASA